ncbi:MAG: dTDP-4-dehydrorhamnose 3,5-epimerase [Candidatus Marsarchaeota archaeon]|nr:dTDP-4-dehydrorhamnose 3,5-epimerase [Candidatus Marsarchaeota archaeon]
MEVYRFTNLGLGVTLIENEVYADSRGFFMEGFNKEAFMKNGIDGNFIQYNISRSKKGVLRGLHFQLEPYSQAKLVRCLRGEIFDVAVDIRKNSPTFGSHVSVTLKGDGKQMIFVPRNFAHGFLSLGEEDADVMYYVDNKYAPDSERGIAWNDSGLGIRWPEEPTLLSKKDQQWPKLSEYNFK